MRRPDREPEWQCTRSWLARWLRFSLLLVVLIWCEPALTAGEPSAEPNIRVELQVVAVSGELAGSLMGDLNDDTRAGTAIKAIQTLLKEGKAKMIARPTAILRIGGRAMIETTAELRTPAAFQPDPQPTVEIVNGEEVKVVPPDFETHNTGISMGVEATTSPDGDAVTLRVSPVRTFVKGVRKIALKPLPGSADAEVGSVAKEGEQPDFDQVEFPTTTTLHEGKSLFLGAVRSVPGDGRGMVEIYVLKADLLKERESDRKAE